MIFYLENDYQFVDPSQVEKADAIVVLSGMVRTIQTSDGFRYELAEASDRIFAGIELFKEKKSSTLVLTRGLMPWSMGMSEGDYLRTLAIKFGIPEKNILLTEEVKNTDDEAKSVKKIMMGSDVNVILVTSAFHMPRAKRVFEMAGIRVIPYAVDFLFGINKPTIMDFIPSADGLNKTTLFAREMIGRIYYKLKYINN